jgi:DNA-binding NarL/FixJ family response regulator
VKRVRILVADDHDLVRRGVINLLLSHEGWSVCGEARTGREAVTKANGLEPDIVILDISMPELNGLEAARRILATSSNTEILILSMHHSEQLIREIVDAGVRGYIVKSDSGRELISAVENLANHKPYFTPKVTEVLLGHFNSGGSAEKVPDSSRQRLTGREREIVQLLDEGKSAKEVSALLGISIKTTEKHRSNIMNKLEIHSVTDLVRYALRNQIVEP